jgi:4-alpha-glucanotransferase
MKADGGGTAARRRESGVLLHISSLPSVFGIGDLGPEARSFADFLARSGQGIWQVLPLNPTDMAVGNSPYHSSSVFAGNPLFISPELLLEEGLLDGEDLQGAPEGDRRRVDYETAWNFKDRMLVRAWERFRERDRSGFDVFCGDEGYWLDDFARFAALKKRFWGHPWNEWPRDVRDSAGPGEDDPSIEEEKFRQYLFFSQWRRLRDYCHSRGVQLCGDLPIYPTYDSADVWCNRDIFRLDDEGSPLAVAGVPPDYFSETGQLWGNPVYDWERLRERSFDWWLSRVRHSLQLFDFLRMDHFRGLVAYWEVPAGAETSVDGRWVKVPTDELFSRILKEFPPRALIAEDLGIITEDVTTLRKRHGLAGMTVLAFAFGDELAESPYLPHNFEVNSIVYTGTHDNNTIRGWFEEDASAEEKERLRRYLGRDPSPESVAMDLVRLGASSVAELAIVPMQDILGLGAEARMNRPSTASGNWEWRLLPDEAGPEAEGRLYDIARTYGRLPR